MKTSERPATAFPNGQIVCPLGQGTWKMGQSAARRQEEIRALRHGIELGMNLVDTAEMYDNEELVGEAKFYRTMRAIGARSSLANAVCSGSAQNISTSICYTGKDAIPTKKPSVR